MTDIYLLKDGFGLLREDRHQNSFISLIFLDFCCPNLQKLHTVEYPAVDIKIVVDKADPATFLLKSYMSNASNIYKIVKKTIILDKEIEIEFYPDYFYDKSVYFLKRYDENLKDLEVRISYLYT
jgi:hypothetical protein